MLEGDDTVAQLHCFSGEKFPEIQHTQQVAEQYPSSLPGK